jgi:hypothetical protein
MILGVDAKLGQRNAGVMHRGVREHDRIVVVCSKASLTRCAGYTPRPPQDHSAFRIAQDLIG